MSKSIWLLSFTLFSITIQAQVITISGTVKDSLSGEELIGATIIYGDSGTTTGYDGKYTIELDVADQAVQFSYVGYVPKSMTFNSDQGDVNTDILLVPSSTILETTTVTGSKYQRSISRSPVSISVIKPQLVENTNTVKINALLDKVPGVQIVDNQAIIRGGSGWSYGAGSRVLLLIDDIPALQADAGRPLWGDVPVENIGQIEILKGASSTLYGSSAMNGIINIRTGYATSEPVTKAFVGYTYYMDPADINKKWWDAAPSRWSTGLVHKRKIGKFDLVANGYYENLDSYYEDGYDRKYRLSANGKYKINDRVTFAINSLYNYAEAADSFIWLNGGAGAYKGSAGTFSERNTTRYYIDPQLTVFAKNNDRHKFLSRYYYVNNDNNLGQANSSTTTYLEYQYLKSFSGIGLEMASGVVGQFLESNSELFNDAKLNSNNFGAYTQVDYKLNEDVTLTGGLRYEYNVQKSPEIFLGDTIPDGTSKESKLIARVGLNYSLGEATFVRASWGQGYRYPTMAEKFIRTTVSSFQVYPNINLESETGWSSEIGIKQALDIAGWKGYVDASLFWSQYENMTEFTAGTFEGSLGFQSVNVGATDIKGFEISIEGQSQIGSIPLTILGGYTLINPKYQEFIEGSVVYNSITAPVGETEKVNFLKYRSRHNFKTDVEAMLGRFRIGLSGIYVSEVVTMDALLSNFAQIGIYREAKPGGYFRFDGRIAVAIQNFKISIHGNNILNKEYTARPGLLEAPRNISLRIDVDL